MREVRKILPLVPFPPMHWWAVALSGHAIIDGNERYVKQSLRNRLTLCDDKGSFAWSFALDHVVRKQRGKEAPMASLPLSPHIPQRNLLKALATAYGRAPFFEHVMPEIEEWMDTASTLGELSWKSIEWMADWGGIHELPELSRAALPYRGDDGDYRVNGKLEPDDWDFAPYLQPFEDRNGFLGGCSGLDAVMGLGRDWPDAARKTRHKSINLQP